MSCGHFWRQEPSHNPKAQAKISLQAASPLSSNTITWTSISLLFSSPKTKIPSSGILQLYVPMPSRLQELTQHWDILLLNSYVQVFVRAGLLAKECIDAPSTIDPDFDAQLF